MVFDSTEYHPEKIVNSEETYDTTELFGFVNPEWGTTEICPYFQDFTFVMSESDNSPLSQTLPDLEPEDEQESFEDYSNSFDILSQRDDFGIPEQPEIESSRALSVADPDSPELLSSQLSEMAFDDVPQYDEYESQAPNDTQQPEDAITQMLEGRSNVPSIDFIKNLVTDTTEYNYFNNALMSNWAGPEHWKFKATKNKRM